MQHPHRPAASGDSLALRGIDKRFGETVALQDAHVRVRSGTVHALLGENGAGKSTLMNVAFGLLRPDVGELLIDGVARTFASPADAIAAGVGMVHQHYMLVPAMTVAENVALGSGRSGWGWRLDLRAVTRTIRDLERSTGLRVDPNALVGDLGVAAQQRVEIVKALARGARLLILDEPTAVLTPTEATELLAWVRRYAAAGGAAVLITHKLREALTHADDVTVLRHGATVRTAAVRDVDERTLVQAMLGDKDVPSSEGRGGGDGTGVGPVVLALEDVSVVDERGLLRLRNATVDVRRGEIVGVAAIEGAGQRELLRVLSGRLAPASGIVRRPDDVAFVPEDRQRDALVMEMPLVENVVLRDAGSRRGRIHWSAEVTRADALMEREEVRGGGPRVPASSLSGGNQQRLVLARELEHSPAALVVESPTRGLDVRASAAVHARLREERDRGAAVLAWSADIDELLAIADRVVVVHAGQVIAVECTREAIGRALLGAT